MKSVGIQPEQLPRRACRSDDNSVNIQFLKAHRAKERMVYPTRRRVGVPGPNDVLFGKGSRFQDHVGKAIHHQLITPLANRLLTFLLATASGNIKFRNFIAGCRKKYEKTQRGEKQVLTQEIVDAVKQSSGLFLKADGDGWIVVDDTAAAYKVGAVFRTLRSYD